MGAARKWRHLRREVVPRLFGESSASKGPVTVKLTEADIKTAINGLDHRSQHVLHKLLEHGEHHRHHAVPGTAGMSSWYNVDGSPCSTWAVYPSQPKPVVSLSIGSIHEVSPERARRWVLSC